MRVTGHYELPFTWKPYWMASNNYYWLSWGYWVLAIKKSTLIKVTRGGTVIWILFLYMSETSFINKWGHGGPLAIEFATEKECRDTEKVLRERMPVTKSTCISKTQIRQKVYSN